MGLYGGTADLGRPIHGPYVPAGKPPLHSRKDQTPAGRLAGAGKSGPIWSRALDGKYGLHTSVASSALSVPESPSDSPILALHPDSAGRIQSRLPHMAETNLPDRRIRSGSSYGQLSPCRNASVHPPAFGSRPIRKQGPRACGAGSGQLACPKRPLCNYDTSPDALFRVYLYHAPDRSGADRQHIRRRCPIRAYMGGVPAAPAAGEKTYGQIVPNTLFPAMPWRACPDHAPIERSLFSRKHQAGTCGMAAHGAGRRQRILHQIPHSPQPKAQYAAVRKYRSLSGHGGCGPHRTEHVQRPRRPPKPADGGSRAGSHTDNILLHICNAYPTQCLRTLLKAPAKRAPRQKGQAFKTRREK